MSARRSRRAAGEPADMQAVVQILAKTARPHQLARSWLVAATRRKLAVTEVELPTGS